MIKTGQQKFNQTLTWYFYAGQASVFGASSDSSNSPKAWLSDLIWIHLIYENFGKCLSILLYPSSVLGQI